MGKDDCGVCGKDVNDNGLCCERCEEWSHLTCVNIKTASRILEHSLIVFLCTVCLDTSRTEWKRKKEDKEVQTEANVVEKAAQTSSVQAAPASEPAAPKITVESREVEVQVEDVGGGRDGCGRCEKQKDRPQVRKAIKSMPPIRVVGDSMMKNVKSQLGCKAEGSGVESLSGARIGEVRRRVEEKAGEFKEGSLLIIQGGGNDLENVGTEDTVREVVEAVKAVEGKNVRVAVVGVMRRPREGERYERVRQRTNIRLQEALLQLKVEWLRGKKGNVSFVDLDGVLREGLDFTVDGVHLNQSGHERMGRRLREWRNARSVQCVNA